MLRGIFTALVAALAVPTVASATWLEAKTPHFIIYSEHSPADLRAFADRLERFDQAARSARGLADHKLTDANRLTVYVLRDQPTLEEFAGRPGVHGFYIGRASGPIAFVHRGRPSRDKWDLTPEGVFFHEYMHHLMLSDLGGNALPAWMTEGYAEFFGTAVLLDDGSVQFGAQPRHRARGLFTYEDFNATLSTRELIGATYKDLTGPEWESVYGKGWLLTHYMAFEPSRRGQVTKYVNAIQQGQTPLSAAEMAFGDLGELDKNLARYLMRKKVDVTVIPAAKLHVGAIEVTPLQPAAAAAMEVIIYSQRGVDKKQAPLVLRRARQVAEKFPADPIVQAALAEAELDDRQSCRGDRRRRPRPRRRSQILQGANHARQGNDRRRRSGPRQRRLEGHSQLPRPGQSPRPRGCRTVDPLPPDLRQIGPARAEDGGRRPLLRARERPPGPRASPLGSPPVARRQKARRRAQGICRDRFLPRTSPRKAAPKPKR